PAATVIEPLKLHGPLRVQLPPPFLMKEVLVYDACSEMLPAKVAFVPSPPIPHVKGRPPELPGPPCRLELLPPESAPMSISVPLLPTMPENCIPILTRFTVAWGIPAFA